MPDEFAARLKSAQDAVERVLTAVLDARDVPDRLLQAMRHAALSGGKRIRPFLMIEAARAFGKTGDGVIYAAAALECVHCYSVVHDDLPAMDDDDLRRGKPTVHRAFDEATAILAGDALLTLAFGMIADPRTDPDPATRLALSAGLARAAGFAGMVGGQMLDLAAETQTPDESGIVRLQAMKTGALFRFAADAGAILGRANTGGRAALARYGDHLGLAFQLADDLIDATSDAATAGKATSKDAGRGKATLVGLHGVAAARARLDGLVAEAIGALAPLGREGAATLAELARRVADRNA